MKRSFTLGIATGALSVGITVAPAMAADVGGLYYPSTLPTIENPIYAPTVQAHVDLYGGKIFYSGDGFSESAGLLGGAGRINVPFQNAWNLQLDAQGSALLFHEDGDSVSYAMEFSGYAHAYRLVPEGHALGVFGGASWLTGPQAYTAGVEGQMYWPQFTLYGQASVSALRFYDESGHALQLRGQGQWFATDNTAVMGDVIWTHLNQDDYSGSVLSLAGTLMHRFAGTPFAGFGKVRWDHSSFDGYSASATTALLGVRVMTGMPGSTLKRALREVPMNVEPIQFGLLGGGIGMVSDIRLKRDIVEVARLDNGIGLYRYRYVGSDDVYVGVMAQEVAGVVPSAVMRGQDGYLRVDYGQLGFHMMTLEEWNLLTGQQPS